jgi:hypothetical protein
VKGFFRDKVFAPMLVWLLVASYSIVVFPWFALSYYWWWILLLPVPLTVYAGHGLEKSGVLARRKPFRIALVGFLLLGIVAAGYASSVIRLGYPYAYTYMPSGLVESCVKFGDIPDVEAAFLWVNENAPIGALVVVPEKLQGFASMHLRADLNIRIAPPLLSLDEVTERWKSMGSHVFGVCFLDETGRIDNKTEIMATFNGVGIFRIWG